MSVLFLFLLVIREGCNLKELLVALVSVNLNRWFIMAERVFVVSSVGKPSS